MLLAIIGSTVIITGINKQWIRQIPEKTMARRSSVVEKVFESGKRLLELGSDRGGILALNLCMRPAKAYRVRHVFVTKLSIKIHFYAVKHNGTYM